MNWGNLFGGIGNSLKNIFGGASNAIGGALKTGGQALGGAANSIGGGIGNVMNMFGGGGQAQAQAPKTSTISGQANMFNTIGQSGQFAPTPGATMAQYPSYAGMTNPESSPLKQKGKTDQTDLMSSLFPGGVPAGVAGLAMPAIGNMFAPKAPNIPDINSLSSVQALQNFKPGNSVSPEYQQMIQNNVGQLRDQKVRELQALYHNARPGTDYLTDSNYQRDAALLDQGIQNNMTDELAKAEGTFSSQEQERLSQIAQMDIYSIMAQTGMKAQEAQQFKEMFSNVGNVFLTNATRDPNNMSSLMSMFGGK